MNPFLQETTAVARLTAATGVAFFARGCVTGRTGAGIYTCTLDRPMDANECIITVTVEGAGFAELVHTSDTIKTITVRDHLNAVLDANIQVAVQQVRGGTNR